MTRITRIFYIFAEKLAIYEENCITTHDDGLCVDGKG